MNLGKTGVLEACARGPRSTNVAVESDGSDGMLLNYNHLYYFHIAAIEGTVAAAAQRLGVTAATVSEQLRSLERALGVDLFERMQTGLKLTDGGRLTFEHTSPMFGLGERLIELLGHEVELVKRMLRVGVSSGIARSTSTRLLMPLFGLADWVPALRTGDTVELLRELRAGMLDLVLCESEPPELTRRGLEIALIAKTPLVAIAPPHLEPAPDWQDVGLIQYRATTSYRKDVEAFLDSRGLKPQIAGEADDSLILVEAAARGGFVAVVPSSVAREAIQAGRLRILAQVEPSTAGIHALYQDNVSAAQARRAVQVLMAQMASELD